MRHEWRKDDSPEIRRSAFTLRDSDQPDVVRIGDETAPSAPSSAPASMSAEAEIHKIAERQVAKAFVGGASYHELKELLHVAKGVYHAGKELVESLDSDEE